jgi:beta-galactosidase
MMQFWEFDHYRNCELLDFATFDSYPTGQVERAYFFDEGEKLRWARTGHPDLISWNHDLYRGLKGNRAHWVMEQGAGQVNWAPFNCLPAKGAVALWTAQAWAHGASTVSYFRWRAAEMAQELMHSGLLRRDETLDRGGQEIVALEIVNADNSAVRSRVALLHDYECQWIYDEQPHSAGASYWAQNFLFYSTLRGLGVDVDIRHPEHDLAGYDVVVAPALQLMSEDRALRLGSISAEARLVLGPRTGFRTPTGRVHEDGPPGPLRTLAGWSLLNFDGLRPGLTVRAGGHEVGIWAEAYRLHDEASALVRYDDGPLVGEPAVVRRGNVTTIGAWSSTLVREVLTSVLTDAGVPTVELPDGVRVSRRGPTEVWVNFNLEPARLPDGRELPPVAFQYRGATAPS